MTFRSKIAVTVVKLNKIASATNDTSKGYTIVKITSEVVTEINRACGESLFVRTKIK